MPSGWLPAGSHWDESYPQGQQDRLLSAWPWEHPVLCPELVFMLLHPTEGALPQDRGWKLDFQSPTSWLCDL